MSLLHDAALATGVALFCVLAQGTNAAPVAPASEGNGFRLAQIQPGPWSDGRDRLGVSPGEICAEEGGRLYGIQAKEFKTLSVQSTREGGFWVRLSVGRDWYACTLDRLHGLVDFRGG